MMTAEATDARPEQEQFIAEARENRITKVVVFDHGAYLQRRVRALVHAGLNRIQVKGLEMTPEPDVRDWKQREGVTLWDFETDTGSTREISVRFFVKHPKDTLPDGL